MRWAILKAEPCLQGPLSPQYGEVLNLVLSSKKAGTAVVEFATVKAAVSAA